MIDDNKQDFMASVNMAADEFRKRSFEECMEGFLKSMVKESTIVDLPAKADVGSKMRLADEVDATIKNTSKEIMKGAMLDNDTNENFNVDLAHEIVNPASLTGSISQTVAHHVFEEANDKKASLEAMWDSGAFHGKPADEIISIVNKKFLESWYGGNNANGRRMKQELKELMSSEGEELIKSIKEEVKGFINETEAKNSVIREAVAEINTHREKIENKINGDADKEHQAKIDRGEIKDENGDKSSDSSSNNGGDGTLDQNNASDQGTNDGTFDPNSDVGQGSVESWTPRFKKTKILLSKEDFYMTEDGASFEGYSHQDITGSLLDKTSFSLEAAEEILKEFRELDDGINSDDVSANKNTMSADDNTEENTDAENSDNENTKGQENEKDGENDGWENLVDAPHGDAANSENTFGKDAKQNYGKEDGDIRDDDGNININYDAFEYHETAPEPLSEESLAKDFLPLSLNKMASHKVHINNGRKLACWLALQPDHGQEFFDSIRFRANQIEDMINKEKEIRKAKGLEDGILQTGSDPAAQNVDAILKQVEVIKFDTGTIVDSVGEMGILGGNNYVGVGAKAENALKSLFDPSIVEKGTESAVEEHKMAEIYKIALDLNDVVRQTAEGINVTGNRHQIGYLEELLNEKLLNISDPLDRVEVESRVKALNSLESIIPFEDMVNIQAFVSENSNCQPERKRITLDSLKNIDAYGFSFDSEIAQIKSDIKKKFDKYVGKGNVVNFEIDELVNYIADEKDTTKIMTNLYEQVISKLVENSTIENATESLILRNKAKTITTAFVTADRLGFLSSNERDKLLVHLN